MVHAEPFTICFITNPGEKCFRGFNGIRTHGLCVSGAVLHKRSYEYLDVRHYGNIVEPLLSLKTDENISTMETTLNRFKNKCALEGEIKAAEENLKSVAKAKKQLEELDRKRKEAEDKRQEAENKQAEEEKKFKATLAENKKELAQEMKGREEAEREREWLKEQHSEAMRSVESLK